MADIPYALTADPNGEEFPFGFGYFIKFLTENNVIAIALASLFSDRIREVTTTFVQYIIMPIINRDADGDGVRDIAPLEKKTIKFAGMTFEIGKFILAVIKFMFVVLILYAFYRLLGRKSIKSSSSSSSSSSAAPK